MEENNPETSKKSDFSVGDVLVEILEVAIHLILYTRNIYPDGIFIKCQKYGISVMMSQHHDVNAYIKEVLTSIRQFVNKGDVTMLVLQITDLNNKPLEKFCFELKTVARQSSNQCFLDIETHLRALLLKINTCEAMLQPLPKDCTFQILVHTNRSALSDMEETQNFLDFPWVRSDESKASGEDENEEPVIIPIRSCSTEAFALQCFVEERKNKT